MATPKRVARDAGAFPMFVWALIRPSRTVGNASRSTAIESPRAMTRRLRCIRRRARRPLPRDGLGKNIRSGLRNAYRGLGDSAIEDDDGVDKGQRTMTQENASDGERIEMPAPYLLLAGGAQSRLEAKTAIGVAYWRPEAVAGQLRLARARRLISACRTWISPPPRSSAFAP